MEVEGEREKLGRTEKEKESVGEGYGPPLFKNEGVQHQRRWVSGYKEIGMLAAFASLTNPLHNPETSHTLLTKFRRPIK